MIFTIDTEKDNVLFIRGVIKAIEAHIKNPTVEIKATPLIFDSAQRACISTPQGFLLFGSYDKGAKENWYKVTSVIDPQGQVFATPDACKKWLTDRYTELVTAIINN